MDTVRIPVGMTVLSLAGKDKGRVYAVIGTAQGPYVYVADGRKYPKSDCKKKNCRHLRPLGPSANPDACRDDLHIRELVKRTTEHDRGGLIHVEGRCY